MTLIYKATDKTEPTLTFSMYDRETPDGFELRVEMSDTSQFAVLGLDRREAAMLRDAVSTWLENTYHV